MKWVIATGEVWHADYRCAQLAGRYAWHPYPLADCGGDPNFYRPCKRCAVPIMEEGRGISFPPRTFTYRLKTPCANETDIS